MKFSDLEQFQKNILEKITKIDDEVQIVVKNQRGDLSMHQDKKSLQVEEKLNNIEKQFLVFSEKLSEILKDTKNRFNSKDNAIYQRKLSNNFVGIYKRFTQVDTTLIKIKNSIKKEILKKTDKVHQVKKAQKGRKPTGAVKTTKFKKSQKKRTIQPARSSLLTHDRRQFSNNLGIRVEDMINEISTQTLTERYKKN